MYTSTNRGFLDNWFSNLKVLGQSLYNIPELNPLKKVYRALSLLNHPDKCSDCEDEMALINFSFDFLKDYYNLGVTCHQSALCEAVNNIIPLLGDIDIVGKEETVGKFLSDFYISI